MIQRLRLANWRAYDQLDVELGPGATFVVASNGIGKTSLVMAAAWGIFGDLAGVHGGDEIRGDAETATVTIDLRLPTSGDLVIERTVDQRGRQTIDARVAGRTIDSQEDLDRLYAEEFGAESHVLAQLTFMIHGGLHETQGEFELRDHLAALFGVRSMFEAAERADAVAAEAASSIRKTKVVERQDRRNKEELVEALASGERDVEAAKAARETAVGVLNEAADHLRAGTEWTNYRRALDERAAKLASYADVAGSLLDRAVSPDDVLDELTRWEAEESNLVSEIEMRAATAKGRAEAIRESMSTLQGADATCPTCLRPFGEHDAEEAATEHQRHLDEIAATISDAEADVATRRGLLDNLRAILADIRSVPVPVEPTSPEPADAGEAIQTAHDAARDELQRHDQEVAMRTAELNAAREALEAIERDQEQIDQLEELHRLEALSQATAKTLRETADAIMQQNIEPLVGEVARRWKQTFGRGGLRLSADGRITRQVGSRTLNFSALSGGERVWALLVARLLVAGASTSAPFVWLDEPLEHLDPRLRRIVAGTLAMASSNAGLKQVIVTTYEAPIAQQLMEDVPSASLLYVSSSG